MAIESITVGNSSDLNREIKLYDTAKSFRQLVEMPDGQTFYRDQLQAEHEGEQIDKFYLYHPDPLNNSLESPIAIQNQGGFMTVGDDYARIGARMALRGHMFTTHKPVRAISTHDQLHHPEHSKDAFLYTAQVGQKVLMATLVHQMREFDIDLNTIHLTLHSYGGPVGTRIAKMSPEVEKVLCQDVAGVIDNPLKAHVMGIGGIISDGITTGKAVKNSVDALTPDLAQQHIDHTISNKLLTLREGKQLVFGDSDIAENVHFARNEYGTKFAGIFFTHSDFFPHEEARATAQRKGLYDAVRTIDARHSEPNTNPLNADNQLDMFTQLDKPPITHRRIS